MVQNSLPRPKLNKTHNAMSSIRKPPLHSFDAMFFIHMCGESLTSGKAGFALLTSICATKLAKRFTNNPLGRRRKAFYIFSTCFVLTANC